MFALVPSDWVEKWPNGGCYRAVGGCMAPTIEHGALVFVDPEQRVEPGRIVMFHAKGEPMPRVGVADAVGDVVEGHTVSGLRWSCEPGRVLGAVVAWE